MNSPRPSETGQRVLVFNSGSSSLKFGLYQVEDAHPRVLLDGEAEAIGRPGRLHVKDGSGQLLSDESAHFDDAAAAVAQVKALVERLTKTPPQAIGHRLVHGGPQLLHHALIDAPLLAQLRAARAFAPLHMPAALAVIDGALALYPELPQAACLDTAFHAGLPDVARTLPLPKALAAEGMRRYGFHGLSCESILAQLPAPPARVIIAHLGSGASITAVREGRSIDTSMGMTPEAGVIMGTRCGDIDPGALIWIARLRGLDHDGMEELVTRRSGLLGISGLSGDMQRLREQAPLNADAQLAVRMFCNSVAKQIAAQATALGGIDLLIFTGGIGEHDAATRAEICALLGWVGIRLDDALNRAAADHISTPDSACAVRRLATAEGAAIARHVWRLTHEA